MYKKHQLVMLSTNEEAEYRPTYFKDVLNLNNSKYDKSLELFRSSDGINIPNPQHLYLLSDKKIEVGDWLIVNNEDVMQMKSSYDNDMGEEDIWVGDSLNGYATYKDNCKKIIATTNISLTYLLNIKNVGGNYETVKIILPQIPKSFIKYFVSEYNKSHIITNVMVEYEKYAVGNYGMSDGEPIIDEKLKINPDNNTINIKPIKNNWNKYEHIANLIKYREDYETLKKNSHFGPNQKEIEQWSNKWIEENL